MLTRLRWATDDFHVTADEVLNNTFGIFIWSYANQLLPWNGGYLCVQNPIYRTAPQFSGGTPPPVHDTSGHFSFHFSQALMASEGLLVGSTLFAQYWYRDPFHIDGIGIGITDGLEVTLCP